MDNNDNKKQLNFELKPEIAQGTYSNLAIISHSRSEFIIDFAAMLPGLPKPEVRSRIVMTPEHCKRLLGALTDNTHFGEAIAIVPFLALIAYTIYASMKTEK